MNECARCRLDFTGVSGFDRHRRGSFDYTYLEGLDMDPPREDGRRCLGTDELSAIGFLQDEHGRWFDAAKAESARTFFAR